MWADPTGHRRSAWGHMWVERMPVYQNCTKLVPKLYQNVPKIYVTGAHIGSAHILEVLEKCAKLAQSQAMYQNPQAPFAPKENKEVRWFSTKSFFFFGTLVQDWASHKCPSKPRVTLKVHDCPQSRNGPINFWYILVQFWYNFWYTQSLCPNCSH